MRALKKLLLISALSSAALLSAPQSAQAGVPAADNPDNWPQYHRTSNAWRYSPLDQISPDNIKNLKVAWIHQPGDIQMGLQATPIVIDGIVYYIGPNNNVFAVEAASGKQIWHYQPDLDEVVYEVFYVAASRGVTVGHGNVYIGSLDGRFIALDQKTGKEKWSTQITEPRECYGCLFSSPPQLAGDILFGGTTGGDQPTQGKIYAVNAITGEKAWTFDILDKDNPASWPGDSGEVGGSGAWLPGTYDEQSDTIFIGTANAAPDFYGAEREGDNKHSASLLALSPKDGSLKWAYQEIPHDVWDFDSAYEAISLKRDGKDLLVHLNKSGFVFVLEKDTGTLENVWPLAENINFAEGIDKKTGALIGRIDMPEGEETTVCPYLLGARSWNHGAYNPDTGLWYTNAMEVCNQVVPAQQEHENVGMAGLYLGVSKLVAVPPPGKKASARLDARDPITGELKWSVDYPLPGLGSVLTTGGNLVFNGDPRGIIHAYNAQTGQEVWDFNAGSGLRGGIVSYAVNGKQYILAATGFGSHAPGFMASAFPEVSGLPGGAALVAFTLAD
ncbi:pyrroloquinoline quinone-dependent dehydrogenase [Marinobacterium rhizophilum]|uniref:pyrroloquinoline quinone-dependent dehydrogenase n=1 Tax=Marinobacterium rhizophilum TaxID=420402 RepID=UPI0003713B5D|nr:PQQ-binding-like beta-propeller repeat protein [Marinobacterium rhizophilum]